MNLSNDYGKSALFTRFLEALDPGATKTDYTPYQGNPKGFITEVLGDTLTPAIEELLDALEANERVVAQSANGPGKSWTASRYGIYRFKCYPGSQVYITSAPPEGNLRKIVWAHILDVAQKHPEVFEDDKITDLHIARSPVSFISGVLIPSSGTAEQQESKFSGKHSKFLTFILDEADAIGDPVYKGIEGCLSGGHCRFLAMFNPRSMSGPVWRMIRDNMCTVVRLCAFDHPNVVTGENIIGGAVNRQTVVRRINDWTRPLIEGEHKGEDCFELPEFLEGAIAVSQGGQEYPPLKPGFYKVLEPVLSYMVLGQYPTQASNQLISREWILQASERYHKYQSERGDKPPDHTPPVMGLDVGEFGSDSNVACLRYGGYVAPVITWQGVDVTITADRATAIYKEHDVLSARIDAIGIGAGVAPHMQRLGCSATAVKTSTKPTQTTELGDFGTMRDQLWWAVREWLRTDPGSMLPPDEMLIEELQIPTYEVQGGKLKIMKKDIMRELLKRSPDRADALCLTFASGGYFQGCII